MKNFNFLSLEAYHNNQEGIYIDEENNEVILQTKSEFGDMEIHIFTKNDLLTILSKLQ